jgi:metal-responsive CopG/Arc/MetJ family transcriptional regulator
MDKGSRRVKLTVSLSSDLVKRIEKRRKKGVSRSEMFEQMLEESDRAARKRALDEEIEAYYSVPPTAEEQALSRELSRLTMDAWARNSPDDDFGEPPVKAPRRKHR